MDRAAYARAFFESQGWSPVQAAALVGNLMQESFANLDTNAMRKNDAGPGQHSMGIAQWNRDRLQGLYDFSKQRGTSWNDLDTQLAYVQHELNTSEKAVADRLRAANDIRGATAAAVGYERPVGWTPRNPFGAHGFNQRLTYATKVAGLENLPAVASGGPKPLTQAEIVGPGRGTMAGYRKPATYEADPTMPFAKYKPGEEITFYADNSPALPQGGAGTAMGGFMGGPAQVTARQQTGILPNIQPAVGQDTADFRPSSFQQLSARQAVEGDPSQRMRLLEAAGLDPTGKKRLAPRGMNNPGILSMLQNKFDMPKIQPAGAGGGMGGILGKLLGGFFK